MLKLFSRTGPLKWIGILTTMLFAVLFLGSYRCEEKSRIVESGGNDSVFRFGFYNLENLFDTKNDAYNDDDFTPSGANEWTKDRYNNKLAHLAKVIAEINPDAMGVCEVENESVLKDLIETGDLKKKGYSIVHYDSPDERGIDVAFIYRSSAAEVISSVPVKVELPENDKTRDLLYIQMKLKHSGDTIHYFVNHWPSRREGTRESSAKREIAAQTLHNYISNHNLQHKSVLICGDFNDNPWDSSVRNFLGSCRPGKKATCDLFNLMALLDVKKGGTLKHAGRWDLFDQLMVSRNLWYATNSPAVHFKNYSVSIFSPDWLKQKGGKFDGSPFRTYGGKDYLNGYSDHFPVFAELLYE